MPANTKTAIAGITPDATGGVGVADSAPAPGTMIGGKYEVGEVLGDGGMGVVVSARHLQLDRRVALKFLKREAAASSDAAGRFLREARAASAIHSEHVARVLDVGTLDDGRPFMVMEHLVGLDMADVLDRGPLQIEDAVGCVLQVCEAIAEAHQMGVVHRDLKPSNLFLTEGADGSPLVKVLDFGIAKALDGSITGADASLTLTGTALGSPIYMSPEQVRNAKNVDRRTDIWGIGMVLYELIAQHPPFDADTIPSLCAKIVTEEPKPLRDHRPEVPPELQEVINRCLAKDPAERYQSVSLLAEALEPFSPVEASALVARVRRIAAGRRSIPDATPSWSQPHGMADTVPSRPGLHHEAISTADGVTATAPEAAFPGSTMAGGEQPRRRRLFAGSAVLLAALVALVYASAASEEDPKTVTLTMTSAVRPVVTASAPGDGVAVELTSTVDPAASSSATPPPDERDEERAAVSPRPPPKPRPVPTLVHPPPRPAPPPPPPVADDKPIDPLGDRK